MSTNHITLLYWKWVDGKRIGRNRCVMRKDAFFTFLCLLAILRQARVRLSRHHFTGHLLSLQDHQGPRQLTPKVFFLQVNIASLQLFRFIQWCVRFQQLPGFWQRFLLFQFFGWRFLLQWLWGSLVVVDLQVGDETANWWLLLRCWRRWSALCHNSPLWPTRPSSTSDRHRSSSEQLSAGDSWWWDPELGCARLRRIQKWEISGFCWNSSETQCFIALCWADHIWFDLPKKVVYFEKM